LPFGYRDGIGRLASPTGAVVCEWRSVHENAWPWIVNGVKVTSMIDRSTATPVVAQREDTRTDGPMTGGERAVLDHWLDLYRDTALRKIAGLDAEQLTRRAVPPSSMSLIGVVRHLTEVEAYWLRVVLLDEQDVPDYYWLSGRFRGRLLTG